MHTDLLEAKVVILGSQAVGKTSLVVRYVQKTFTPNCSSTIGASFMTTKLVVDNFKVRLQIWDTAGQERFRSMAPMYYRGANAAIIVYDITNRKSFEEIEVWLKELQKNMTEDLIIHIVGSKFDLASTRREVTLDEAVEFVDRTVGAGYTVHEVSAKDDEGVDEIFVQIARQLVEKEFDLDGDKRQRSNGSIYLNDEELDMERGRCCN
ncbi:ras-like GTP-binding protein RYL2 [Basidiobolus meristosporus CBS 931.73]|uniref:Ras-like GTP-binding protein RYL2 n=1 Tax=Basidiobolus meristosporus CBS 931.73 TaxID=1314790 RepID=A0A1Y1YD85_9FUNG|nr:ras-like GTP-binding protein RYL2 [Basidiobolus meristosporus CBS 931.73]|eukprot:ORX95905.1 ras-like GTP-binding protein RYL2 [Basidiobolus meristosporus CBS 931.73]